MSFEYEQNINRRLADLLKAEGLSAKAERQRPGGRRIDVLVEEGGLRVAVEAEIGLASKKLSTSEAVARLEQGLADAAVAVCYPDLADADDLKGDTRIWVAPVGAEWSATTPRDLAEVIRNLREEADDIDKTAVSFRQRLEVASDNLVEKQVADITAVAGIPLGSGQPALRAALLVASACLFHARLDGAGLCNPDNDSRTGDPYIGPWPFSTLGTCLEHPDPVGELQFAWDVILSVDYTPVFETAIAVLGAPRLQDAAFTRFVRGCGYASLSAARALTSGQMDLLGRVFHWILDEARHTGAYYTSTAAATLLASLAIQEKDIDEHLDYTIVDPSCGTGTLLAAAADRIRRITGQRGKVTGRHLIENVLHGYDIDIAATHMAAVALGLMAPDVSFKKLNIHRFNLGLVTDPITGEQMPRAGSLELMDGQAQIAGWPRSGQVDTGEEDIEHAIPRNLVIMNPPFTRDSLRHDQLGDEEEVVKERERQLFKHEPAVGSHSGGMFLCLAEKLCDQKKGTIAIVYPTASCGAPSAQKVWDKLLRDFHLEMVITSHDPNRIFFSENTNSNESLMIFRRLNDNNRGQSTRFINLAKNPATPAEAILLADEIREDGRSKGRDCPRNRLLRGDWSAVRFLSPYLSSQISEWFFINTLTMLPLAKLAELGPAGRRIHDAYKRGSITEADEYGRFGLWFNNQDKPKNGVPPKQSIRVRPDASLLRKASEGHKADRYWKQRGRVLLPTPFRISTARTFATRTEEKVLGAGWVPVRPKGNVTNPEMWEKAISIYLNSTVGILAQIWVSKPKLLSRPQMPLGNMRRIPVPQFDDRQVLALADHYDRVADRPLLRLRDQEDDLVRASLDETLCLVMDWDKEEVQKARFALAVEPSVTGQPAQK